VHCRWQSRFDDPEKRVRTIYCATDRLTCFYEVLAPFRPDATALVEMSATGTTPEDVGCISMAWRRKHALSPARIQLFRGSLINLDSVPVREQIARRYPWLLQEHGVDHLDRDAIQGPHRELTQALGKLLYREGAAGVLYPSKLDGICAALFERRARLIPAGRRELLTESIAEFQQACDHLHLTFDP
jgi:hypothetical protein